jgi:hypothetical protein
VLCELTTLERLREGETWPEALPLQDSLARAGRLPRVWMLVPEALCVELERLRSENTRRILSWQSPSWTTCRHCTRGGVSEKGSTCLRNR